MIINAEIMVNPKDVEDLLELVTDDSLVTLIRHGEEKIMIIGYRFGDGFFDRGFFNFLCPNALSRSSANIFPGHISKRKYSL